MAAKVQTESGPDDSGLAWGVNVTPLVDVCLVLVIIFIVTAQAVLNEKLEVTLPIAKQKENERKTVVTVTIAKNGDMTVNSEDVSKDGDWKANMKNMIYAIWNRSGTNVDLKPDRIIVRADKECKYSIVRDVLGVVKDTGFADASIATKGPPQQ